ncbi:MAG TPA: hypothetical protein VMT03_18215 [Polyangia bacterium]|nr:hypothetical protein [Polyangia bacterium]
MRRPIGLAAFVAAFVAAVAAPRSASALCASCLGQASTLGTALRLVGLFLLVPPAIFFAVAIAIRRVTRRPQFTGRSRAAASDRT